MANNGTDKRCILKLEYKISNGSVTNVIKVDIFWFFKFVTSHNMNGQRVDHCENVHASYHNSGVVHLVCEKDNTRPTEFTDKIEPPLKLTKETRLYYSPLLLLENFGLVPGPKIKTKKCEILDFDSRKFGYPLYNISVFVLPPNSTDTSTEIIDTDNSRTFIVKKTKPWIKIVVEAPIKPVLDRALRSV